MSPEQISFMIGSIYGSVLTLLLLRPSTRSRNRRDPFLDCREHRSAKGLTTPKPSFAELLMPPPRDQDPDWRRSFNHENMNKPSGSPPFRLQRSGPQFNEGRTIRGNGNGGPTTPKPEFPPGRVTDVHGTTIGYRSISYPDPSQDRRSTNPFTG